MGSVDSEYAKSKDAGATCRDDYVAPELKLVGKVSELAQAGAGPAGPEGGGYS